MHMISHQTVGMHRAVQTRAQFAQVKQIKEAIALAPEAVRAVVSALPEMHGDVGNDMPQRSRHDRETPHWPSR